MTAFKSCPKPEMEFRPWSDSQVRISIRIGNHRDDKMLYVPIQNAQEALAREEEEIVMVSRQFKTFAERGLMKDEFHYCQEGYNLIGEEAGRVTGKRIFLQCS